MVAQSVFGRCLMSCLDVNLWMCYLRYIKVTVDPSTVEGAEALQQVGSNRIRTPTPPSM